MATKWSRLLNGNEATLKTFYKERGQIRLQPANKNYKPIMIKSEQQFALQGVLLDVIRTNETEQSFQTFVLPVKKITNSKAKYQITLIEFITEM